MSAYHPDVWVPILIDSRMHGKVYKVLAGWYGGFTGSNSWKLSSGVESLSVEDHGVSGKLYIMPQASGSVYVCHENNERLSMLTSDILSACQQQADESGDEFTIAQVEMSVLFAAFPPAPIASITHE